MRNKFALGILLTSFALGFGYAETGPAIMEPVAAPPMYQHFENSYKTVYSPLVNTGAGESQLPHLYALHINGIGTTKEEADQNLRRLKDVSQLQNGRNYLIWDVVYNPTADVIQYPDGKMESNREFFTNVWDVLQQKNRELKLNNMMSLDDYLSGLLNGPVSPDARDVLREIVRPDYQSLIKHYSGKNIDTIIDHFHEKVPTQFAGVLKRIGAQNSVGDSYQKEPIAVLLLPHSQGNLYANELYQYLTLSEGMESQHIAIFGIGSPAEKNLAEWPIKYTTTAINSWRYNVSASIQFSGAITDCSDGVIGTLRTIQNIKKVLMPFNILLPDWVQTPNIVSCNYSGVSRGSDPLNHSLIDHYLNDANRNLKDKIVYSINYYAYVLDYVLMQDLTNNLMPKDKGYNKYRQTIAFAIGDLRNNNSQIIATAARGKIWGPDYDLNANPSGLLYIQEPLMDKLSNTLMHFYAAPSSSIVTDGYDIKTPYSIYEDTEQSYYWGYFYIYPAGGKYSNDDWYNSFFVVSYPWNENNNKWPWDSGTDGTCIFHGVPPSYSLMPDVGKTFANGNFGVPGIPRNQWYSYLTICLKMPPAKTDRYLLDGWYHNLK